MLLSAGRARIDVLVDVGVGVLRDLDDRVLVHPFEPILGEARVLLARAAHDLEAEVVLGAARPCPRGAVVDAHAAADAEVLVAHDLAVDHGERAHRAAAAPFHALLAADAAVAVVLRLGHADDAEVVEGDVRAVVGAARERDLHVAVVGEDRLVHAPRKRRGVVAAEGAQARTRAAHHVAGARRGIALAALLLVHAGVVDDGLQALVDLGNLLQRDAGDLHALAVGEEDRSVAELLGDLDHARHALGVDEAAGNAYARGGLAAHLGLAEGVLHKCFDVDVE